MSAKKEREKRQEERIAAEQAAGGEERRKRLLQVASALVFLAVAVVLVLIVVNSTKSDGGDTKLEDVGSVREQLGGIPQHGLTLGDPKAKVTLVEFGDLQCPVCKAFSEEIIPGVIESQVRGGEAQIEFRNFTIISEQSVPAGAAAIAAGEQGRGWNFVELFYRNQGEERSGYVTDEFLTSIAKGAGVPDMAKWNEDRKSKRVLDQVHKTTAEAQRLGFEGTPSFAVEGPAAEGLETLEFPQSTGEIEEAITQAAG
jgi:protein-disulfide isomerase